MRASEDYSWLVDENHDLLPLSGHYSFLTAFTLGEGPYAGTFANRSTQYRDSVEKAFNQIFSVININYTEVSGDEYYNSANIHYMSTDSIANMYAQKIQNDAIVLGQNVSFRDIP